MTRWMLLAVLMLSVACQAPTEPLLSLDGRDGGGVVVPNPDAGADAGFDAGVDAGPDAGPADSGPQNPVRGLVRWSPLGTSPVENLVMNPSLDTLAGVAPEAGRALQRYIFAQTPTGQPVLQIQGRDTVIIPVQARLGGVTAEVRIGRRGGAPRAVVSLAGLDRDGALGPIEVALAPTGTTQAFGDIVWQRMAVLSDASFMGTYHLMVENQDATPLFVSGPVVTPLLRGVVASDLPRAGLRPLAPARARVLAELQARAAARAREQLRSPPDLRGALKARAGSSTPKN